MIGKAILLLGMMLIFAGCASDSSLKQATSYRDPLTYSFEAYTPSTEKGWSFQQFLTETKETARKITEWEKKYLW